MGDHVLGTLDIAHIPRCGLLCECNRTAERLARLIAIALHNSFLVDEVQRLNHELNRENAYLRGRIQRAGAGQGYVADSPPMRVLLERADQAAATDTTVLIRGETGTGKEGLARRIHDHSPRGSAPFVVVNVGAIPEGLIESELFGHEKGAFTGASARRLGCFEQADGGTLFLDEIGDAPLAVQVKLLRAIQEREIQRVGGRGTVQVDVRLIAATHRPLERMIEDGTFRSDLYYRLAILPLTVPPLRERPGDIRALTSHLVARHAARMGRRPPTVPDEVFAELEAHIWLGNVRELENFVERALIFSPGLSLVLPEPPGSADSRGPLTRTALPDPAASDPDESSGRFDDQVRELLRRALQSCRGKIYGPDGAAEKLGLRPTTLQGKLRRYGVRVEKRTSVQA
jgi:formate hydrogenlyase transcriptional activator